MGRKGKQALYGLLYLVIAAAVITGFYFLFVYQPASCFDDKLNQNEEGVDCGGGCEACAIKNAKEIIIGSPEIFNNNNQTTTVFIKLENKNNEIGIENLPYTINLFNDRGDRLFFVNKETFIYSGKSKFIVEAGINIDPTLIKKTELLLDYDKNSWKFSSEFSPPLFQVVNEKIKRGKEGVLVSGEIVNDNPFPLKRSVAAAILRNNLLVNVAGSQTVIGDIPAFAKIGFEITVPVGENVFSQVKLDLTKIFVEVKK